MRYRTAVIGVLLLSGGLLFAGLEATAREIRDDQGRVVLVVADDGTTVSYSYDEQGNRIATERSDGSRMEANPSAPPPPPPTSSQPGARTSQ